MPRHDSAEHHFYVPYGERRPMFLTPEPVWVIDNYRVKRWYYRTAPEVGAKIEYLEDGTGTRVKSVKFFSIFFENGLTMRRPYVGRRLGAWLLPRLQNRLPKASASSKAQKPSRRLRPDVQTILV